MSSLFYIFTWLADVLTYSVFQLSQGTKLAGAVHFFIEDITKIFALVVVLIYLIGLFRASMNIEKVRNYLQGKHRIAGYVLAALLGAITPFCSCSSIPLFLAFTAARIPIGITMAFLITSPIVNEVAILVLGSVLGWQFTIAYVAVGVLAGVFGGMFFDFIRAERFLTDLGQKSMNVACCGSSEAGVPEAMSWRQRHVFAKEEVTEIFSRIWKWIILGINNQAWNSDTPQKRTAAAFCPIILGTSKPVNRCSIPVIIGFKILNLIIVPIIDLIWKQHHFLFDLLMEHP